MIRMTRNSARRPLLLLLAGLAVTLGPALRTGWAQLVKGTIEGVVIDSSGAVVPGAEVVAIDRATSSTGRAISDSTGAFRIPLLAIGTYELTVTKFRFRQAARVTAQVNSAATTSVGDLVLSPSSATTNVTVEEHSSDLETTQSQITNSLSGSTVSQLPVVGQNEGIDFLSVLLPGIHASRDNNYSNQDGVGFSSNGIRGRNNDQQIDGQNNNDNSVAGPAMFFGNMDWVEEYQVTTSNFGVEYSRNSGSVVNIVTKSGTNSWHGDAFITENSWKTSTLTNTQKAFEGLTQVPAFNDEFSGISLGGPILKNKLFVFGGFDDELEPGSTVYTTGDLEPTPAGLAALQACLPTSGVLKALAAYGPYAITAGNPQPQASSFTMKTITGVTCANGNALSATPIPFAGVQRTLSTPVTDYGYVARVDYQRSRDRVYARVIHRSINDVNSASETGSTYGAWAGYPVNVPSISLLSGLDWTRTFSPNLVNEARLSYGRETVEFGGNAIGNTLPDQGNLASGLASVNPPAGYAGFGYVDIFPQGRIVNTYQLQDNLSWVHGKHLLKMGTNLTYQRSPNVNLTNYNGSYSFSTLAGYLQDIPSSVSITLGNPDLDFREHDTFLYIGDDFRATKNLTLNLGLSYAYYGQPGNLFHRNDVANETGSTPFFNPNLPLSVRTFPELSPHYADFGPGIGFAYAPHGGKTVIRGGYRLTYDPAFYNFYLNMAGSTPQALSQTLTGSTAAANPLPAAPLGPAVRTELTSYLTLGVQDPRAFDQTTVAPNFGPDHVQGWSFGIQRQLSSHVVVESRFVGNHGGGLFQSLNGNPYVAGLAASFPTLVPAGVTPCSSANAVVANAVGREYCNLGVERLRANTAVSDYAGWQNELRANNLLHQLTLSTSFTWSKTTDNASEIFNDSTNEGVGAGSTIAYAQDPFDTRHGEHGLSGIDFPAQWTLSFVENIPFHHDRRGWLGHLLGGWAVSGTYIISSGQPWTPIQECINACSGGEVYDSTFDVPYVGTYETARPFMLSPGAPVSNVAIYAGDLCAAAGSGCNLATTQLLSLNAFDASGAVETISPGSARFVANGAFADTVHNTPWGNVGRNTLRDAGTNFGSFEIAKETRVTERVRIRFDTSFLNVFNHPNFNSVDPFIDDAGFTQENTGFGIPSLWSGGLFPGAGGSTAPGREIKFGLKVLY